jgi:hypothetical protein
MLAALVLVAWTLQEETRGVAERMVKLRIGPQLLPAGHKAVNDASHSSASGDGKMVLRHPDELKKK